MLRKEIHEGIAARKASFNGVSRRVRARWHLHHTSWMPQYICVGLLVLVNQHSYCYSPWCFPRRPGRRRLAALGNTVCETFAVRKSIFKKKDREKSVRRRAATSRNVESLMSAAFALHFKKRTCQKT